MESPADREGTSNGGFVGAVGVGETAAAPSSLLPLWEKVTAEGCRMRGLYPRRQTPHPSQSRVARLIHPLPQGEREERTRTNDRPPRYPAPAAIRSRYVDNINGLRIHVLEAGFETPGRPCLLLLHGFPELAFSWREVMPALAAGGYHVIAPDQRGYGRTTGWDANYDGDLASFRLLNLVRDALGLVSAFGYRQVDAVIGHDFGSSVAAWCALVRPDVFRSVALMSAPFAGAPSLPFDTADAPAKPVAEDPVHRELAGTAAPAKTLPVVLLDARGQRRHAPRAAGRA